jgi:hypothetical protein
LFAVALLSSCLHAKVVVMMAYSVQVVEGKDVRLWLKPQGCCCCCSCWFAPLQALCVLRLWMSTDCRCVCVWEGGATDYRRQTSEPYPSRDLTQHLLAQHNTTTRLFSLMFNLDVTGVVVDRVRGLVVCDRDTVPCTLGDVDIIVASVVEIPANVLFVHPLYNYAVLQYDPKLLGDTEMGELALSPVELEVGASCTFVGLTRSLLVSKQTCHVVSVERIHLGNSLPPRFTARNQDGELPAALNE